MPSQISTVGTPPVILDNLWLTRYTWRHLTKNVNLNCFHSFTVGKNQNRPTVSVGKIENLAIYLVKNIRKIKNYLNSTWLVYDVLIFYYPLFSTFFSTSGTLRPNSAILDKSEQSCACLTKPQIINQNFSFSWTPIFTTKLRMILNCFQ